MASDDSGNCVDRTGHAYRRVFLRDINPEHANGDSVIAVCCHKCGRSPLHALHRGIKVGATANGDWPKDKIITGYFWDENDGPSVDFVDREEWNRLHPNSTR